MHKKGEINMKLLSIGNSFSQNAQRYLKGVCDAAGADIDNYNLYIGGCSFERHYNSLINDIPDYLLEHHGKSTDKYITVKEGLALEDWDIITVQEVSSRSYDVTKFEPYMSELVKYVREVCPKARIALHMTWGYGSEDRLAPRNFASMREMFDKIKEAYRAAYRIIGADMVIPSGEAMSAVAELGYTVHSDGSHANHGVGEYSLSLTWLRKLFGISAVGNGFRDFLSEVSEQEALAVQRAVDAIDIWEKP